MHYGSPGERLRMLNEYIQCVRALLTEARANFKGEFFTLDDAQCEPKPVQERLPIWIGGGGEKVTLRIAAQHADGWNVPFIPPEVFAHKANVLDEHCAKLGRDPATISKTVNVGMAFTDEDLKRQFGPMSKAVKPGVLSGSVQEMVDKVSGYVEAGAVQVNLAMRAPFDRDGLERFGTEVLPALRG
jgi:alkanesulfonate monooxygenase SsuD/methylene tetrahydromethanopterin reductase-like flavin-dependent oxidoreductase (luciferase family)